jgi:hypothetical protein
LLAARPVIRVSSRHRPPPALLPLLSLPGSRRPSRRRSCSWAQWGNSDGLAQDQTLRPTLRL